MRKLSQAIQVGAGHAYSCAILKEGKVKCWGWGKDGALGNGKGELQVRPSTMKINVPIKNMSTGWFHTCVQTKQEQIFCTGRGDEGQLGNGKNENTWELVPVSLF